jgi:serine/threonine protein kinase
MGSSSSVELPVGWVMPPPKPLFDQPVGFGEYLLISSLGKGDFGEAFLAVRNREVGEVKEQTCEQFYRSDAPKFVVKRFGTREDSDQERRNASHVKSELALAGFTACPHVLSYGKEVKDEKHDNDATVFEYCNAGDLKRLVKRCVDRGARFSVFEVLTVAEQLCKALLAFKKAKVVHGDVALRNVFLHWDPKTTLLTVKLGDFGICQDLGDSKTATFRDKYSLHMAPEVDGKTPYDQQIDVYSFGVVLYELMAVTVVSIPTRVRNGTLPIFDALVERTRQEMEGDLAAALQQRYVAVAKLAQQMMLKDPALRIQIEAVAAKIQSIIEDLPSSGP